MVDVAALVLEIARLVLVVGIAATLFVLGRRHDLDDADGWRWIQVGLVFFIVESGFDVLNEFLVDRPLVAGVGLETLAEEPVLLAGFACLAYGLYRWLPLPAKLEETREELESANERLEARVEERTGQLEDANERLAQLLDHTPAIIYTCEPEPPHELTWLCENTRHVIDVPADQLQAEADTWLAHVHPEDREAVRADIAELAARRHGGKLSHEYRVVVDGRTHWLHEAIRALPKGEGEARELIASAVDVTEQMEAQRMYERVLDAAEALVFRVRGDVGELTQADVEFLGPAVESVTGYPPEAYDEDPGLWFECVHPDDREEIVTTTERMYEKGEPVERLYRFRHGDTGEWVWLDEHVIPDRDPRGEVIGFTGISRDVTEKVEAERARLESQAQLQRVIGEIDVVLFSFDEEGCYTLAEGRGLEALGLEPEDVVGRHVSAFYDQPVVDLVEAALDGEKIRTQVEYEGAWLDVQLDPRYEDGEVVGADGVALNVTDVVEAEREASRERHRYQQILKAVPRCIVHIDTDGRFTYANDRAQEVLGLDPSDVSGRAYNDPDWQIRDLDGNEIPDDQLPFRRVLDTGEVVEDARHTIRWPDGTERVLSVHGAPIFDGKGDVESTVFALADITERLEREREIELERDLRAALFEENVDPIMEFGFDEENRAVIRDVNHSFRSTFGYDADEVCGRRVADVIVPEGGEAQHEEIARRILDGEHVGTEVERVTVDGLRTFRLQLTPLELEDDRPGGYAWFTDLTKLRELEEEEAFKARMLDQVGQAVNATDADGTITYWNQHAEEMFGYTAEEATGENIYELVEAHEEHREEIMDHMRRGEEWTGELAVTAKDGSTFPAVFTKEPILDEDGELDGVIGISYDVTDLRKLEREEALKAKMLDEVGQAVIVADRESRVRYWNAHAEEMFGWTAEEIAGEALIDHMVPDTEAAEDRAQEMWETINRGETWRGECTVRRKDGTTFPAILADTPIEDDDGNLEEVIRIAYDISPLKETQRKLSQLTNRLRSRNRELRDLSQAAAHGFRTPIWDTVRYLDLLEATAGDVLVGEAQEHLETARAGAHRLHDLVESLQEYLDASTRDPGSGPTDAGAVLDDVLASLSDEIEASGAEVHVEEPVPELAVDAPSLADTFRHLLENAIMFSGDGPPSIEVAFEREDEMWVVSVSDDGCGIAPEYQERVFRPFRTLHGLEEGGGAGLGLALCRGFVEIHGGAIWVNSTPGQGTTVNMTLPAAGHGTPEALEALGEEEGFDEDLELFE